MHIYSSDCDSKNKPNFQFASLAIVLSGFIANFQPELLHPILKYIPLPSAFILFVIFNYVANKWLWKIAFFRSIWGINVPDISGKWSAEAISSHDGAVNKADFVIKQTWSRISIVGTFANSKSVSLSANMKLNGVPEIEYIYENTQMSSVSPTLTDHKGAAILKFDSDNKQLFGNYYTFKDRNNSGKINLKKN